MTKFLYRNLEGQRTMVAYAVALTVVGVGADILSAFPLKFILDKIVHHQDPIVQRERSREHLRPDHLVERVVAPDVLAHCDQ